MKRALRAFTLYVTLAGQLAFLAEASGPGVSNAAGDLTGTNYGDLIQLVLSQQSGAHEYVMYRAYSGSGPWTVLYSVSAAGLQTSRSLVDVSAARPPPLVREIHTAIEACLYIPPTFCAHVRYQSQMIALLCLVA